jgi:hypothetical protein
MVPRWPFESCGSGPSSALVKKSSAARQRSTHSLGAVEHAADLDASASDSTHATSSSARRGPVTIFMFRNQNDMFRNGSSGFCLYVGSPVLALEGLLFACGAAPLGPWAIDLSLP